MKNIFFLLFLASTVMISACATTETSEAEDSAATEATSATPADTTESAAPAATETAAEETPAATTESAPAASDSASDGSDLTWVCTHDGSTRTIKVIYHDEGPKVCEVTYEKASGTQSLWNANNDRTYCEDKAIEFVTKQEGWGWSCNQQ
jgi:hypothetical protein